MEMVKPQETHLASYTDALKRAIALGTINIERAQTKLSEIAADPKSFLAKQEDPEALGGDIRLPNGIYVPRIPAKTRFLWDGEVRGTINFRWQVGTTELPDYYLGHIGFEVFSWKRNMGYASEALRLILSEAIELGMPFVELVTNVENPSSQKVIAKNGGVLFERFIQPQAYGGVDGFKYRIYL
jgi:predicted acetyltransferase